MPFAPLALLAVLAGIPAHAVDTPGRDLAFTTNIQTVGGASLQRSDAVLRGQPVCLDCRFMAADDVGGWSNGDGWVYCEDQFYTCFDVETPDGDRFRTHPGTPWDVPCAVADAPTTRWRFDRTADCTAEGFAVTAASTTLALETVEAADTTLLARAWPAHDLANRAADTDTRRAFGDPALLERLRERQSTWTVAPDVPLRIDPRLVTDVTRDVAIDPRSISFALEDERGERESLDLVHGHRQDEEPSDFVAAYPQDTLIVTSAPLATGSRRQVVLETPDGDVAGTELVVGDPSEVVGLELVAVSQPLSVVVDEGARLLALDAMEVVPIAHLADGGVMIGAWATFRVAGPAVRLDIPNADTFAEVFPTGSPWTWTKARRADILGGLPAPALDGIGDRVASGELSYLDAILTIVDHPMPRMLVAPTVVCPGDDPTREAIVTAHYQGHTASIRLDWHIDPRQEELQLTMGSTEDCPPYFPPDDEGGVPAPDAEDGAPPTVDRAPVADAPADADADAGCGCTTTGTSPWMTWLLVPVGLAFRRRR